MDRELTKVIEDFDCAINVEALLLVKETRRLAEKTRKHSFISISWLCILRVSRRTSPRGTLAEGVA